MTTLIYSHRQGEEPVCFESWEDSEVNRGHFEVLCCLL